MKKIAEEITLLTNKINNLIEEKADYKELYKLSMELEKIVKSVNDIK